MLRLNGVPVQWVSRRQPTSAKSPAATNIYALSEGVELARQFQWCLQDLGEQVRWPMKVLVDNNQAISFSRDTCVKSNLRGTFNIRWHWVKELKDASVVCTVKVASAENPADILTKCFVRNEFHNRVDICHVKTKYVESL